MSGLYARLSLFVGCDEYGESSPACMYYDLWINNPTCNNEYPDYTYEEHFGKILPSYVPRAVVRDYLEGKMHKVSLWDFDGYYCIKIASHAVSSRVLTSKNPCYNNANYILFMHGCLTVSMYILGPS